MTDVGWLGWSVGWVSGVGYGTVLALFGTGSVTVLVLVLVLVLP